MKTKLVPSLVANHRRAIARTLDRISGKATTPDSQSCGTSPIGDSATTGVLCPDISNGQAENKSFRAPLSAFTTWSAAFLPIVALLAFSLQPSALFAQRGPQDTWYEDSVVDLPSGASPHDITVTAEGTLLVTDTGNDKIHELEANGSLIRSFGSTAGSGDGQFNNPIEVAIGPSNRIYLTDNANHRVQILERNGTFVKAFGTSGTGDGQFDNPWGLAISSNGEVFVADQDNHRIQVFDSNGTFLRKWGEKGNLDGQLNHPHGLDVDQAGNIYVVDNVNKRIMTFTAAGDYLSKFNTSQWYTTKPTYLKLFDNGLIATGGEATASYQNLITLREKNGALVKRYNFGHSSSHTGTWSPSAMLANGTIIFANRSPLKLHIWRQTYRTLRPNPSKDAPLPEVISVTQPAGTNHLEVKYHITDADSSKVKAGLLAFKEGGNDLSKLIIPQTFTGSIAGKLDDNVTTGQVHTVTWDARADWNVTYGNVELAVVAQDNRALMNFHFLTLPATDTNTTELKISRSPIDSGDLLNAWYVLLGLGHSGITFNGGSITLTATGESLASGSTTTAAGRQYLFDQMNLRQANTTELNRAREAATPGVTNKFTPSFKVGPSERPTKVNEYGFDSDSTSTSVYWVVPKS